MPASLVVANWTTPALRTVPPEKLSDWVRTRVPVPFMTRLPMPVIRLAEVTVSVRLNASEPLSSTAAAERPPAASPLPTWSVPPLM